MEFKIINKVRDLPNFDKDIPVFCDIETDGLYGPTRMLQVYQPQTSEFVYIVDIAPIGYDKQVWAAELFNVKQFIMEHYTVWYNASYDLGTLNISPSLGIQTPNEVTKDTAYVKRVDDLLYAVKTAYPEFNVLKAVGNKPFSLKNVVTKIAETRDMYKNINTKESAKSFVRGAYISNQAHEYAAKDVYALSVIYNLPKIQRVIEHNTAYKVDMMSQAYALIYQQNGLLLDRDSWHKELQISKEKVTKYTALLPKGLNPNSWKQVRAYLETDKSDHDALVVYSLSGKPKAKDAEYIIELKKYKKRLNYLKSIDFDRMYTKFNVAGAISGRFTSSGGDLIDGFNSQQVERDMQYLFNSDTEDTTVVGLDYSTVELRLACAIFGSKKMYEQFKNGEDLHTSMAALASGKTLAPKTEKVNDKGLLGWGVKSDKYLTENDRQSAKGINFGYVFGMSAKAYVPFAFTNYGVKVSYDESKYLRDTYFSLYPEFAIYHGRVWNNYKKPSFVVKTALGRRVKPKLGTDGINIPVQGSGSETIKLAVHYMVKENPLILKYLYNVIHDAAYGRYPRQDKQYWEELQRRNMLKGWTEISKCDLFIYNDIPMLVE